MDYKFSLSTIKLGLLQEASLVKSQQEANSAQSLKEARIEQSRNVEVIGQSGDIKLIIDIEKSFVEFDLERYTNSRDMEQSLTTALKELSVVEEHIDMVNDPVQYAAINKSLKLPKHRRAGLPYDPARQGLASHFTRLRNSTKSRLSNEEKLVLEARKENIKTAAKLYTQMQTKMIEQLNPEAGRDQNHDPDLEL